MVSTSTSLKWCLLALCLQPVMAKQSDYNQKVYVDSVRQVAELNNNKLTFLDDVVIRQGTIEIHADKVEVIRHGDKGADEMIATGRPARFHQVLDNGKPVDAQATRLSYKLKQRLVILSGNARIQQSDNEISGDQIRYDIQRQQMVAESSGNSRVKTIFLPEEMESFDQPAQEKP